MYHLTDAVRRSVQEGNWYSALSLALVLPDICGKLENPTTGSEKRYVAWWSQYAQHKYQIERRMRSGTETVIFLNGGDVYALRCAFLHEGVDDISSQRARKALDRFHFIAPPMYNGMHNNRINTVLQLQVDIFCDDVCTGVDMWSENAMKDQNISNRLNGLMKIHEYGGSFSFRSTHSPL